MREYVVQRFSGGDPAAFRRRYAGELNPQQLDVVTAPDGPLLVLAGAGSGKTRTVTYRVAYLLDQGIEPEELLLLTFTNKAAREMLRRVEELVAVDSRRLWGGTFHRVANLILRQHASLLGYTQRYSILDREDSRGMMEATLADFAAPAAERYPKAEVVTAALSYATNTGSKLAETLGERWPHFADLATELDDICQRYQARKLAEDAMDYDDLLVNVVKLLGNDPGLQRRYARRFRHVLVDEYQDSNHLQAEMIDLLASVHRNVMVVGDDAQSIYSFRGADCKSIFDFSKRYADARTLKLEINYRSTPDILNLANAAIAHNDDQLPKTLRATRPSRVLPAMVPVADAAQQASFVASRILQLRDEGTELGEIAVLYRSHWHCLEVQLELSRRRIPYEVRSGVRFFESAHVKDVLAHLRIVLNPRDGVAWRRLLRLLPRVGTRTAEKIFATLASFSDPLAALASGAIEGSIPKAARPRWKPLRTLLVEGAGELAEQPAQLIRRVLAGWYSTHLYERFENADSRIDDLNQLALFALSFDGTESFLTELALSSGIEAETTQVAQSDDESRVVLSSIHQAKGLEWRSVFVLWLVEDRFPAARSLREDGGEQEERRLFYVAVTRARDELYLCHPLQGRDEYRQLTLLRPSRFLVELPEESFERWRVSDAPPDFDDLRTAPTEVDMFDDLHGIDDDHVA